jgi:UDP-N-acetylglucosamine--N-acetylmuramyl-(pentapeptide) pyrophosphoryl-undecaprenol N-acetylglucosamine transferase
MGVNSSNQVLFVGSKRGIEARIIPETEFEIRFIATRGLKRTGPLNKLKGFLEIPLGVIQSIAIIHKFQPDVVLGVGGYASAPVVAASYLLGIPRAIQEQNSVMGSANTLLAKISNRIFISWEGTLPKTDPSKTLLTGNPIRADLLEENGNSARGSRDSINILIFGGSAGAASINRAMIRVANGLKTLAPGISIRHQTGKAHAKEVKDAYENAGVDAVVEEFINDMGPAYNWADMVICRGGAGALSEIAAMGKPAIIIPYPYAVGDHQAKNAALMAGHGAIRVIPDTELETPKLTDTIAEMANDPENLKKMAEASGSLGRPEAAYTIAKELMELGRSRN